MSQVLVFFFVVSEGSWCLEAHVACARKKQHGVPMSFIFNRDQNSFFLFLTNQVATRVSFLMRPETVGTLSTANAQHSAILNSKLGLTHHMLICWRATPLFASPCKISEPAMKVQRCEKRGTAFPVIDTARGRSLSLSFSLSHIVSLGQTVQPCTELIYMAACPSILLSGHYILCSRYHSLAPSFPPGT